jgi:2'-5' RNA ligase
MNFFLGVIPDDRSNHKIRKIVGEVGRVFDGQQVPVRWVNPDTFHVTILFAGKDISFLRRFLLKRKLKKIYFKPFEISFKSVKLGMSKRYKELVYLSVLNGDEQMRNITEQLDPQGNFRGANSFIPHLTLGRVSKELTDEEFRNLSKDIDMMSEKLNIKDISFMVENIFLIKSDNGNYSISMNCSAS